MSTPTSSCALINSTAPARSDDLAWKHGIVDPTNKNYIRCLHCDKLIKGGGVTRLKEHLGVLLERWLHHVRKFPLMLNGKWRDLSRTVGGIEIKKKKKKHLNEEIGNPCGIPIEGQEEEDAKFQGLLVNPRTMVTI